jgi:hypothetical protein
MKIIDRIDNYHKRKNLPINYYEYLNFKFLNLKEDKEFKQQVNDRLKGIK